MDIATLLNLPNDRIEDADLMEHTSRGFLDRVPACRRPLDLAFSQAFDLLYNVDGGAQHPRAFASRIQQNARLNLQMHPVPRSGWEIDIHSEQTAVEICYLRNALEATRVLRDAYKMYRGGQPIQAWPSLVAIPMRSVVNRVLPAETFNLDSFLSLHEARLFNSAYTRISADGRRLMLRGWEAEAAATLAKHEAAVISHIEGAFEQPGRDLGIVRAA
jgi:hypothetical protein